MQITILSVAAKPQQFFEKKKKKNPYHCPVSNIWTLKSGREKVPMLVHVVFETRVKNPRSKKPRGESVPWRRRGGGRRNAEHTVWVHDVLSSGSKAPVGLRLPRRDVVMGSCFICLTFSQRGWWADQLVSFSGVTWFALLPFSMQGTLSVSIPVKQKRREGQCQWDGIHHRWGGHCLSSHSPTASTFALPLAARAIGMWCCPCSEVAGREDAEIPAIKSCKLI